MSWWSSLTSSAGKYFSSGSGWTDLLSGVASGIAASSASKDAKKQDKVDFEQALQTIKATGDQQLRKSAFEQQLIDYGKSMDTHKKRVAIDTYGQFSKLQQRNPNYVPKPIAAAPVMPDHTKF